MTRIHASSTCLERHWQDVRLHAGSLVGPTVLSALARDQYLLLFLTPATGRSPGLSFQPARRLRQCGRGSAGSTVEAVAEIWSLIAGADFAALAHCVARRSDGGRIALDRCLLVGLGSWRFSLPRLLVRAFRARDLAVLVKKSSGSHTSISATRAYDTTGHRRDRRLAPPRSGCSAAGYFGGSASGRQSLRFRT